MAKGKISDATARRIAALYKDLHNDTKVFTSGCTVCGSHDHLTANHDWKGRR